MQWPSGKSKKFASLPLTLSLLLPAGGYAVEDSKLWLPSRHAPKFMELKKAAEAAEALDRCVTVMRGTIDLDRSSAEHPIYRILCRQPNKRTYNEMVDGLTFETLTTVVEIPVEPTEEELEALRLEEERKKEQARLARLKTLSDQCKSALYEKTKLMVGLKTLSDEPKLMDENGDGSVLFLWDFDTRSVDDTELRYRASCYFSADDVINLRIKGRKPTK